MVTKKKTRSQCAVSQSLDIFGDKWSLLIIRDLVYLGKETYGELLKMEEGIATNILADKLLVLEKEGLITKEVFVGSKSKFKYKLTEKGIDLYPTIAEMMVWGSKYYEVLPQQKKFSKMEKGKRENIIHEIMENAQKKIK